MNGSTPFSRSLQTRGSPRASCSKMFGKMFGLGGEPPKPAPATQRPPGPTPGAGGGGRPAPLPNPGTAPAQAAPSGAAARVTAPPPANGGGFFNLPTTGAPHATGSSDLFGSLNTRPAGAGGAPALATAPFG